MNFVVICVAILAITASLVAPGHSTACTTEEITKCGEPTQDLTAAQRNDTDFFCPRYIKFADCMLGQYDYCSAQLRLYLRDLMAEVAEERTECQKHMNESECSTMVQECGGDGNLIQNGTQSDLAASCRKAYIGVDCIGGKLLSCPQSELKTELEAQWRTQETEGRGVCGVHWNDNSATTVVPGHSTECSPEEASKCSEPFNNMTASQRNDTDYFCPINIKYVDCMLGVYEHCTGEWMTYLQSYIVDMVESRTQCEKYMNESECSTMVQECGGDGNLILNVTQLDLASSCRKAYIGMDCIGGKLQSCPLSELKTELEAQWRTHEAEGRSVCGVHWNDNSATTVAPEHSTPGHTTPVHTTPRHTTPVHSTSGDSTQNTEEKTSACVAPLQHMTPSQRNDPDVYCPPNLEAIKCLNGVLDSYPAHTHNLLTFVLKEMEDTRILCENHLNESECSTMVQECEGDGNLIQNGTQLDLALSCRKAYIGVDCIGGKLLSCPLSALKTELEAQWKTQQAEGRSVCGVHWSNDSAAIECSTMVQECEVDGNLVQNAASCRKAYIGVDCIGGKLQSCPPSEFKTELEAQWRTQEAEGRGVCGAQWNNNSATTDLRSSFWIFPFVAAILGLRRHFL